MELNYDLENNRIAGRAVYVTDNDIDRSTSWLPICVQTPSTHQRTHSIPPKY